MSDLSKFAGQCGEFPAELARAEKEATKKVAVGMADAIRAETRKAAPGGVLIGVSRKGAKVGVQALPAPSGDWLVKATGPFQLIERDTKGHQIPKTLAAAGSDKRKRQQRAGFRGRKVLSIPGIGYRRSVHHPGTQGKHPFEHGFGRYSPGVANVYQRQVAAAMQRTFR
jgi:hypothetical protein